ncbi:MAG: hypothetical protein KJ971_04600 [Firmicutes bacterium]|nr:hypothetical protein [Bacillota bacterium]
MEKIGDFLSGMNKAIQSATTEKGKAFLKAVQEKIELKEKIGADKFLEMCREYDNSRSDETSVHYTTEDRIIKRYGIEVRIPKWTVYSYPSVKCQYTDFEGETKIGYISKEKQQREPERYKRIDESPVVEKKKSAFVKTNKNDFEGVPF